jgi:hypothetical protein
VRQLRLSGLLLVVLLVVGITCKVASAAPQLQDFNIVPLISHNSTPSSLLCLDVPYASLNVGVPMEQHGCHGGDNQRWNLKQVGWEGNRAIYNIVSVKSKLCLDVEGASTSLGARIIQYTCHNGTNQRWVASVESRYASVSPVTPRSFRSVRSGMCIDVYEASRNHGAKIVQWYCEGNKNQLWRFN